MLNINKQQTAGQMFLLAVLSIRATLALLINSKYVFLVALCEPMHGYIFAC